MKKFVLQYYRPIVWAFFIAFLCGIPGRDLPQVSWLELLSFDKFVHASLFFVLLCLFRRAYQKEDRGMLMILLGCIVYGGVLEVLQELVFEERTADLLDFCANTTGSVTAYFFAGRRKG